MPELGELMREQLQVGLTSCYQKPLDTVSWTPESLIFATQTVGTHSAVQTITLSPAEKRLEAAASMAPEPEEAKHKTSPEVPYTSFKSASAEV